MSPAGGGRGWTGILHCFNYPFIMDTNFHFEPYGWFTIHCIVCYCLNKHIDIQVVSMPEFLLVPVHPPSPRQRGTVICHASCNFRTVYWITNIEQGIFELWGFLILYLSTFIISCSIFDIGIPVKNIKNNLALMGLREGVQPFPFTPT